MNRRTIHIMFQSAGLAWPQTIEPTDPWGMVDTMEQTGSVITHLSVMGVTIVKGA